ncbi:MAG: adenosyl-hopene transferase HpnH, partial [Dongiaceae bacterium]
NKRLSVQECLDAVDECGAPMVAIPGGEPLLHKEIGEIVAGIVARKKYVILCTNALLLEKKLHLFTPSPYLTFSVHLDGDRGDHDRSVCQEGVFDKAVAAARAAKAKGFRVNANATLFANADPERMADFFDACMDDYGIDMLTISPGYAYERAPDQQHFLNRQKTRELFRDIFRREGKRKWRFSQSSLFLDFLAGNQTYHCTPWSNPTRNVFGWQKPCYLLGEGYVRTFKELMETTEWETYGTGKYEKCADCMVHCGYEGTAVDDTFARPWKALKVALRGIRTDGPMAPDIALDKARPAEYVFEKQVQEQVALMHDAKGASKRQNSAA